MGLKQQLKGLRCNCPFQTFSCVWEKAHAMEVWKRHGAKGGIALGNALCMNERAGRNESCLWCISLTVKTESLILVCWKTQSCCEVFWQRCLGRVGEEENDCVSEHCSHINIQKQTQSCPTCEVWNLLEWLLADIWKWIPTVVTPPLTRGSIHRHTASPIQRGQIPHIYGQKERKKDRRTPVIKQPDTDCCFFSFAFQYNMLCMLKHLIWRTFFALNEGTSSPQVQRIFFFVREKGPESRYWDFYASVQSYNQGKCSIYNTTNPWLRTFPD